MQEKYKCDFGEGIGDLNKEQCARECNIYSEISIFFGSLCIEAAGYCKCFCYPEIKELSGCHHDINDVFFPDVYRIVKGMSFEITGNITGNHFALPDIYIIVKRSYHLNNVHVNNTDIYH